MSGITLIKNTVKYWYFILIAGIILIGVGLWAIIFPQQSIPVMAIIFSLAFLSVSLFEIIFAVSNKNEITNWGWGLALEILNLLIGIILLLNPVISVFTLSFCIGFLILFQSLISVIIAFDLKTYRILEWGNLLAMGILGIILAILLLINPNFTTITIVIFLGLSLIVDGAISIYLSLKLKKMKSLAKKLSSDLMSRYEAIKKEIEEVFKEE